MRRISAQQWLQEFLAGTQSRYALEAAVLAAGERCGFSERRLRRAARRLGVVITDRPACWYLPDPAAGPATPTGARSHRPGPRRTGSGRT